MGNINNGLSGLSILVAGYLADGGPEWVNIKDVTEWTMNSKFLVVHADDATHAVPVSQVLHVISDTRATYPADAAGVPAPFVGDRTDIEGKTSRADIVDSLLEDGCTDYDRIAAEVKKVWTTCSRSFIDGRVAERNNRTYWLGRERAAGPKPSAFPSAPTTKGEAIRALLDAGWTDPAAIVERVAVYFGSCHPRTVKDIIKLRKEQGS